MALWIVRAGKHGESESKFLESSAVYLQWTQLADENLSTVKLDGDVLKLLQKHSPNEGENRLGNWARQIRAFVVDMQPKDIVILPLKSTGAIAVGEVSGTYTYVPNADPLFRHLRKVKWLNTEVPRSIFGQDLLFSFGAFLTVCRIQRNNA
jgi:restriction system protein